MARKIIVLTIIVCTLAPASGFAADIRSITFPVDGPHDFSDSYGDPRSGGRVHEGVDIFAQKMTPLVAAVDGYVRSLPQDEPYYGYAIFLRDADGYSYRYLHVNNDTPGTDDGQGGVLYAYAPTIVRGARVVAGQLIGWVGDSGNAEATAPHLHFEILTPDGEPINPYLSLLAAAPVGGFNPEGARLSAPTINQDKSLATSTAALCQSDSLVKGSTEAVYYCGADGRRYVFPNQRVYASWYADFKSVVIIGDGELARLPLGGNVTYRPGVRLVKIPSDPKVYAVDRGGTLRYVTTSEIAESMYGVSWAQAVDDLPEAFFVNYQIGQPITAPLE